MRLSKSLKSESIELSLSGGSGGGVGSDKILRQPVKHITPIESIVEMINFLIKSIVTTFLYCQLSDFPICIYLFIRKSFYSSDNNS